MHDVTSGIQDFTFTLFYLKTCKKLTPSLLMSLKRSEGTLTLNSREKSVITVFVSVPAVDLIVYFTVVTVSKEAKVPIKTANKTRPTKNHRIANTFAGIDLGQRSPYLT